MFGFANIRKPAGITSFDVIRQLKRTLPRKTRIGHAGTLDPFAEGVLVICLGPATRLAEMIQAQPKAYSADFTFGATSTTDDCDGQITPRESAPLPTAETIRRAMAPLTGTIRQVPPAYSAVHVDGQRAYHLARQGQTPELKARTVDVYGMTLRHWQPPRASVDIRCGSGTYIRSIARDLGEALGCGGYCSALTRTAVGRFRIDQAHRPETFQPAEHLIKPQAGINLPIVNLSSAMVEEIRHGRSIPADILEPITDSVRQVSLVDADDRMIALADRTDGNRLRPKKVFLS